MLRALVSDLRRFPPLARTEAGIGRMLQAYVQGGPEGPPLLRRPGSYTRTCAYADDRFEVLLLDWSAGSASAIHDHGGQHCWLVVVSGSLRVDDYRRVDAGQVPGHAVVRAGGSRVLSAGEMDLRSGPFDLHRVAAGEDAVSLHVYARPLREFLVYDERAQRCTEAAGTYDAHWSLFTETVAG